MHAFLSIPCDWTAHLPRDRTHLLLVAGACIATTALSLYYLTRSRRQIDWLHGAATVTQLLIYPIKSVAGISVRAVRVTPTGFHYGPFHDR